MNHEDVFELMFGGFSWINGWWNSWVLLTLLWMLEFASLIFFGESAYDMPLDHDRLRWAIS